ncbi:MAG: hypothetical protein C4328_06985, partial [Meiothermus sp.]
MTLLCGCGKSWLYLEGRRSHPSDLTDEEWAVPPRGRIQALIPTPKPGGRPVNAILGKEAADSGGPVAQGSGPPGGGGKAPGVQAIAKAVGGGAYVGLDGA